MEPLNFALAAAAWAVASAVAVTVLGIFSLQGGASRPRGAFAFGLFCILWGLQIVVANFAGIVSSESIARFLYLIEIPALLATPYFLVEFAATRAPGRAPRVWTTMRLAAVVVALLGALLLVAVPDLLFQGTRILEGRHYPSWGRLFAPLVMVPHFLAFGVAIVALTLAKVRAPTPRTASREAILLAGLGIYVAFASANNAGFYLGQMSERALAGAEVMYILLFAGLTATVVWAAWVVWSSSLREPSGTPRAGARLLVLALLLPLVWGLLEIVLTTTLLESTFETVGLWRLLGVAVIAYGLARWRIWDLPQKAKNVAATASGATAAVASGAAAYGATTLATTSPNVPIAAGLIVLGAVLLPSVSIARRIFGMQLARPRQEVEATLYGQRIDAYRAALEASLARDSLDEDADFLAALRERFGIADAEERVLLHYARSSVVVTRGRDAFEAFERLRLLGEGGGGRSWLARDRARDRLVVLKEPLERWQQDEKGREAVLREARLAARVRHPHVVSVEEVVEGKHAPVIVMEYMEGGSLADLLRARGTLPWREAVTLMVDVLRGIEAVHAAGIVHRDVKPSNILLTGEGVAKVADFGIAVPTTSGRTVVEGSSTFAGTLSYVAPEVRAGATAGDKRSDVYACAAVLYECLHGAPPGRAAILADRQADVPPELSTVLARGLAERPEDRAPSARALAEDLASLLR